MLILKKGFSLFVDDDWASGILWSACVAVFPNDSLRRNYDLDDLNELRTVSLLSL